MNIQAPLKKAILKEKKRDLGTQVLRSKTKPNRNSHMRGATSTRAKA